jgi:hypothetical protein
MKNTHTHREAWLHDVARNLDGWFRDAGFPLPVDLRITCGFPSSRALNGIRNQTIGQCWHGVSSADGSVEIMVSPVLAEPMRVADILAHELIHAACGPGVGHKGPFRKLALAIGLEGKMTATIGGEAFKQLLRPILDAVGPYPHAELNARKRAEGPGKQGTRLLKAVCGHCGYTVRITRKWVDEVGAPICPEHGQMDVDG